MAASKKRTVTIFFPNLAAFPIRSNGMKRSDRRPKTKQLDRGIGQYFGMTARKAIPHDRFMAITDHATIAPHIQDQLVRSRVRHRSDQCPASKMCAADLSFCEKSAVDTSRSPGIADHLPYPFAYTRNSSGEGTFPREFAMKPFLYFSLCCLATLSFGTRPFASPRCCCVNGVTVCGHSSTAMSKPIRCARRIQPTAQRVFPKSE